MRALFAMTLLRLVALAAALPLSALASNSPPAPKQGLPERAGKIVAKLELIDTAQAARLTEIIARHYEQLSLVHDQRDAALKLAKENPDQAAADRQRTDAQQIATGRLAALHFAFIARLTAELTPAQVEAIKDGMTYGVAPNTFRVYQQMLPNLTSEQRLQIHAWLLEAREHAIQAGSSEEKHAWFGKYKGRINNYLTKAGYNMKEAEKNLKKQ